MNSVKKTDTLFLIGAFIIFAPMVITLWGWSASVLWAWFVVPVFNLPVLSIPQAIGLCSTASVFAGVSSQSARQSIQERDRKLNSRDAFVGMVSFSMMPIFIVFSGWIVKGFL